MAWFLGSCLSWRRSNLGDPPFNGRPQTPISPISENPVGDEQPQAGTAFAFGREKRVEDVGLGLFVHADAVVRHVEVNVIRILGDFEKDLVDPIRHPLRSTAHQRTQMPTDNVG